MSSKLQTRYGQISRADLISATEYALTDCCLSYADELRHWAATAKEGLINGFEHEGYHCPLTAIERVPNPDKIFPLSDPWIFYTVFDSIVSIVLKVDTGDPYCFHVVD